MQPSASSSPIRKQRRKPVTSFVIIHDASGKSAHVTSVAWDEVWLDIKKHMQLAEQKECDLFTTNSVRDTDTGCIQPISRHGMHLACHQYERGKRGRAGGLYVLLKID